MNRVGEPEYIGENDVSLAFAPSGPIDAFRCSTDEGKTFDPCKYTEYCIFGLQACYSWSCQCIITSLSGPFHN